MKQDTIASIQEWLPILQILKNGILQLKENRYIKIIKITPVNYNLKSDLEKEAILNSYEILLKTCHFNMQILIQSDKEDLQNHIKKIKQETEKIKNQNLQLLSENYINFIQTKNKEQHSSSKNFYIILEKFNIQNKNSMTNFQEIIIQELNENYLKVKECLSRCGNLAIEIEDYEDIKEIFQSFFKKV
ncbi:MAG: hypothetical protein HFJ27_00705 [Clostridia bacterium]|nr:hypothetical protein [Clostridia bacterium]